MTEASAGIDQMIAQLRHPDPVARRDAALVLGDWLYPTGGLSEADVLAMHQALIDAALIETDREARVDQLDAVLRSNRSRAGTTGWTSLAVAATAWESESRELADALISISGDAEAERLVRERALTSDTGEGETTCVDGSSRRSRPWRSRPASR